MSRFSLADVPAGATITEVSPLPSNPNVRRIKVAGRVAARLHAADVEALAIEPGQLWTETLADRIARQIALGKARKVALNALGRRALSRGELIERLTRRGHHEEIAAAVTDQLEADGWIDDAAYAREIAESICRRNPASRDLIVHRLVARNVSPELAERTAAAVLADADPVEDAMALAQERYRSMRSLPPATAARRLSGFLARRGYDAETTHQVIAQLGILGEDGQS